MSAEWWVRVAAYDDRDVLATRMEKDKRQRDVADSRKPRTHMSSDVLLRTLAPSRGIAQRAGTQTRGCPRVYTVVNGLGSGLSLETGSMVVFMSSCRKPREGGVEKFDSFRRDWTSRRTVLVGDPHAHL